MAEELKNLEPHLVTRSTTSEGTNLSSPSSITKNPTPRKLSEPSIVSYLKSTKTTASQVPIGSLPVPVPATESERGPPSAVNGFHENGTSATVHESSSSRSISERLEITASHANIQEALETLCTWASVFEESNCGDGVKEDAGEVFFSSTAMEAVLNRLFAQPTLFADPSIRSVVEALFGFVLGLPKSSQKKIRSIYAHIEGVAKVLNVACPNFITYSESIRFKLCQYL